MSRAKKPKKSKDAGRPAAGRWRRVTRPAALVLLTVTAVGGVLLGLGRLGDEALRWIGPRDRYRVRFADVVCDVPPGIDRPAFLAEVRYVGDFPELFNALDPADRERLVAAFARHPWVETVDGVTVEAPVVVRVGLKFRTPVLAVKSPDGKMRLVDGKGVVLPASPLPAGVAELVNPVPAPPTAGQEWTDDTVKRAVELVGAYHPTRLEKTAQGWRLTQPDGKVLSVGPG